MVRRLRPFARDSRISELHAILTDEPAPLPLPAGCPPALASLVARCLSKAPQTRFTSARDVAFALQAALDEAWARRGGPDTASSRANGSLLPSRPGKPAGLDQRIAYCRTRDGVRIAYATTGEGPTLVRVLGWFTHLEMEWAWPGLREFWEQLAASQTVVRYDGRGIGLSDPWTGEFTEETRELDLEAVLDAVGGPAALLGISEGGWTAAAFAVKHPARVSHLIIYGGYARGAAARPGYDAEEDRALLTLMRKGWGRETPAFRQVFTSQFYREDSDPELLVHFNELQRASADAETAARYLASCNSRGDGTSLFSAIRTPTLIVHRRDDRSVAFEEGRYLASVVPGAQFRPLPGSAHYFPTVRHGANEPGSVELTNAIVGFIASARPPGG
jgi:pimeloyl-ACP methyl ester carboxylesterase